MDACASFVDAVLVLDADANVVAASPSAERLLGATRAELLRPLRDYRARFGLGQIEQTAASALSGQTVAPHLQARTDVTPRRLRVSAAAVRGRRDRVIGAIVVIGDVAVLET